MTPAHISALGLRVRAYGALVAAVYHLVVEAGGVATAVSKLNSRPGDRPVSLLDALASMTNGDLLSVAGKMQDATGPLADLRAVIEKHGHDGAANRALAKDTIKFILTDVISLGGPYGMLASFVLGEFIDHGTPHNSGEGGIGASPEGSGSVQI